MVYPSKEDPVCKLGKNVKHNMTKWTRCSLVPSVDTSVTNSLVAACPWKAVLSTVSGIAVGITIINTNSNNKDLNHV